MGVRSVPGPELRALVATTPAKPQPVATNSEVNADKPAARANVRAVVEEEVARQKINALKPEVRKVTEAAGLNLHFDEATDRLVVQIVNEANEVIKQIPPEELLDVLAQTRELQGLLFDQNV